MNLKRTSEKKNLLHSQNGTEKTILKSSNFSDIVGVLSKGFIPFWRDGWFDWVSHRTDQSKLPLIFNSMELSSFSSACLSTGQRF
jgi:hypothetical protein